MDAECLLEMAEKALGESEEWEEEFHLADKKHAEKENELERCQEALQTLLEAVAEAVKTLEGSGLLNRVKLATFLSDAAATGREALDE